MILHFHLHNICFFSSVLLSLAHTGQKRVGCDLQWRYGKTSKHAEVRKRNRHLKRERETDRYFLFLPITVAYGCMDWAVRLQCGPWSHASRTLNVFHHIPWSSPVVICIWFTHHILNFSSLPTTTKKNNNSLPPRPKGALHWCQSYKSFWPVLFALWSIQEML